jgi:hypothetical protein
MRNGFEDLQDEASEGEDVTRRVVATVGVAVLAENDVLVTMHDLDAPMIAIAGQQSLRRGDAQAGDEMNDLVLRGLPLAVFLELAPPFDAADLPNCRPLVLNPGSGGRQHIDDAPFDAPMRLFDATIPCAEGEKPAR